MCAWPYCLEGVSEMSKTMIKKYNFSQALLVVLAGSFLIISSCGGGGGGGGAQTSPSITNLQYAPKGAYLNSGGGTATITGTLDFVGDISTMTISVFDSNGNLVATETDPVQGAAGITSGTINISGIVDTTVLVELTFEVYLTNSSGQKSNVLTGSFKITEFPWKAKAVKPTIGTGVAASLNGIIYHIYWTTFTVFESYDPAADAWTSKSSLPTSQGGFAVLAAVNGKIYGIGGNPTPTGGTTVEEYNPLTDAWTLKAPWPTGRFGCSASVLNGKIYVIGGYSAGFDLNNVDVYDPANDTWTAATPMPTPRTNLTTAAANGKI
jgi:hypothetical protein